MSFGNLVFQYDLDQSGVSFKCFSCQKLEYARIRLTLIQYKKTEIFGIY
jgi:hypothetical protein